MDRKSSIKRHSKGAPSHFFIQFLMMIALLLFGLFERATIAKTSPSLINLKNWYHQIFQNIRSKKEKLNSNQLSNKQRSLQSLNSNLNQRILSDSPSTADPPPSEKDDDSDSKLMIILLIVAGVLAVVIIVLAIILVITIVKKKRAARMAAPPISQSVAAGQRPDHDDVNIHTFENPLSTADFSPNGSHFATEQIDSTAHLDSLSG